MKVVLLAGGLGTRLSEETGTRPKPMVEIGGRPILWHIMKHYASHGLSEFVICLGYKGYLIKEYFANYRLHRNNVSIDLKTGSIEFHESAAEPWKITLVDTGELTMTGGRIKRIKPFLDDGQPFCLTYGDGLSDINITELIRFHKNHKRLATVTATRPPGRFGVLKLQENRVTHFEEKPQMDEGYINGGFFVASPEVLDLIEGDQTTWEREPLQRLAAKGDLHAYKHEGFWQPMDTLREKNILEAMWASGKAPWKSW